MQNDWMSPSGSRWEPRGTAAVPTAGPEPRHRYRRPVIAVLLTVLGSGAVTTGAVHAQGDVPGTSTPSGLRGPVAGGDHHDGSRGHQQHGPRS